VPVPKIGLDFAIRRFEGMVYWKDWQRSQEEERITMHEAQSRLDALVSEITENRIGVTRNYRAWHGQMIDEGSHWTVFSTRVGGAPKKAALPPPRPPPFVPREKRRILLNRKAGQRTEIWIDVESDLSRNLITIASVAGIADTSE
jgi:hypothetical protein